MWKDMDIFLPGTYIFHLQLPHTLCFLLVTHSLLPKTQNREGGKEGERERIHFIDDREKKELQCLQRNHERISIILNNVTPS